MAEYENDSLEPRETEIEYACEPCRDRDGGYYGTGSTTPPKDYAGVVAGVLTVFILFGGLLSVLGLMKIGLFIQLTEPKENSANVSFTASEGAASPNLESQIPLETTEGLENPGIGFFGAGLEISPSPAGKENIPMEGAMSWQEVYEKLIPSVVSITCVRGGGTATGTGVIMDDDGYILTNAHVVDSAASIQVLLHDGRLLDARLMGRDTVSDLAVLYIEALGLKAAEFGDSSSLRVGDAVVAIGDPLGMELRGTMTDGIISAISRDLKIGGRTMTLIQTTAALNAGNSGGPLINCYGQVVGINTMKIGDYAADGGVEGLGFAIPVSTVKTVVEQLAANGYVSGRPSLGINGTMVSTFYQYYYRLPPGLLITGMDPDFDMAQKGIRTGDVLLSLDGIRITDVEILEEIVYGAQVGDEMTAVIYRGGMEYRVDIVMGESKG